MTHEDIVLRITSCRGRLRLSDKHISDNIRRTNGTISYLLSRSVRVKCDNNFRYFPPLCTRVVRKLIVSRTDCMMCTTYRPNVSHDVLRHFALCCYILFSFMALPGFDATDEHESDKNQAYYKNKKMRHTNVLLTTWNKQSHVSEYTSILGQFDLAIDNRADSELLLLKWTENMQLSPPVAVIAYRTAYYFCITADRCME